MGRYKSRDNFLVWIIIFIIGGLFVYFLIFPKGLLTSYFSSSMSVGEFKQDTIKYLEKNVSVHGMMQRRVKGYSLADNEGNWIWIGDECIDNQRDYKTESQIYTATGLWEGGDTLHCYSFVT